LAVFLWRRQRYVVRGALVTAALLLAGINAGGIGYIAKTDAYHKQYLTVISYLQSHVANNHLMIGPGILGFGLLFPPNLLDDFRLGALNGETPEWIVVNDWYKDWFLGLKASEPAVYTFVVNRLATEYVLVYTHATFDIYRRKKASSN
jgi:hypothetical protein